MEAGPLSPRPPAPVVRSLSTSGEHNITDVYSLGKVCFVALLGTVTLEAGLIRCGGDAGMRWGPGVCLPSAPACGPACICPGLPVPRGCRAAASRQDTEEAGAAEWKCLAQ